MASKICQICGEPSGIYPLCSDCFVLRDAGKVMKCNECGRWFKVDIGCGCQKQGEKVSKECLICNEITDKGNLCLNHYQEMIQLKSTFERDKKLYEHKNHYYNLKNSIFNIWNIDYVKTACLRLIALADIANDMHKNYDLLDRVEDDVIRILDYKIDYLQKRKNSKMKIEDDNQNDTSSLKQNEYVIDNDLNLEDEDDFRKVYPMNIRCNDGHYVRSKSEKIIDDYLGQKRYYHIYEQKVIDFDTGEKFYCDFYLPDLADGIYIEHFGLEEKKYLEKKTKKIDFYKRNNKTLIITEEKHTEYIEDYLDGLIGSIIHKYNKGSE